MLISVPKAAKQLGLSEPTLKKMIEAKQVAAIDTNPDGEARVYKISEREIERLLGGPGVYEGGSK
jgi:excisionase family DNA binding protein